MRAGPAGVRQARGSFGPAHDAALPGCSWRFREGRAEFSPARFRASARCVRCRRQLHGILKGVRPATSHPSPRRGRIERRFGARGLGGPEGARSAGPASRCCLWGHEKRVDPVGPTLGKRPQ